MMRVSVVITTYNRRAVVPDAIDSALRQSIQVIEVIVVDDGSTDGTTAALTERFGRDPRFRIIERVNGGPPAARNTGVDAASGEYLAFLDSDDVWRSEYLASQIEVLENNPGADMVLSNGMCYTPAGDSSPLFDIPNWLFPSTIEAMCVMSYMLPSLSLFRTRVVRELRFDEAFRVCDDTDFMWRFLDSGHRSVANPRTLVDYRAVCQPGGESAPQLNADLEPILLAQYDIWKRYSDRYPQALDRDLDFHRDFAELLIRHDRLQEARWHAERFARAVPDDPYGARLVKLTEAVA